MSAKQVLSLFLMKFRQDSEAGSLFASKQYDISPDILVLAKGLVRVASWGVY